jgi:hypothetical protein
VLHGDKVGELVLHGDKVGELGELVDHHENTIGESRPRQPLHEIQGNHIPGAMVFTLGKQVSKRLVMVALPSAFVNALGKVTISFFFACFLSFTIPKYSIIKYITIYTLQAVIITHI